MKKYLLPAIAVAFTIACIVFALSMRDEVDYVGIPCPYCGSPEVLDYGTDHQGNQHAQCYICKSQFFILYSQNQ